VEFWVAAGGIAGIVSAIAGCVALVIATRKHERHSDIEPSPSAASETSVTAPLELKPSWMYPVHHEGSVDVPCIGLTLINRLAHEINWTNASIDLQDGSGRHMPLIGTALPGCNLPRVVGPHNSDFTFVPAEQLYVSGFDLEKPITARASLGTGETVASQPWTPVG
jgi:hypothetical protein